MSQDEKLTTSGEYPHVYNGIPDWVFEEEVFEDNKALWWSPNGTRLVWGVFNDTRVGKYLLQKYGLWQPPRKSAWQYPEIQDVPYPKVNTTNPDVELWFADFSGNSIRKRQVAPPTSLVSGKGKVNTEAHFSRITWPDERHFAVQWYNRWQNRTVITLCDTEVY